MNSEVANVITKTISNHDEELRSLSLKIHNNPELGYEEYKASALLADYLEDKGFAVTRGAAGMPTSFIAEFTNGKPGRRVAFCSEYDALPGVGHACGHNIIAISGVACAIAIKALLEQNLLGGSVSLFGTPAEEGGNGKGRFLQNNDFQKRADVALMIHPAPVDSIVGPALAIDSAEIEFFGRSSHAAHFLARAVTRTQLVELKSKLEKCFEAAAVATGCQVKISWLPQGPTEGLCYKQYMEEEGVMFPSPEKASEITSSSSDFGKVSYALPSIQPAYKIQTEGPNHTISFEQAARTKNAHVATLRAARSLAKTAATVLLDSNVYKEALEEFKRGKSQ
ncbi:hypothetical protein BDA99DRAFT_548095 [Phascolomyces articulosus]|uniref:Peptidase M20 domain-containing protein 2 n=1 Tax=Phascolomyces articulosus TaxID=60185 RepID=A0AAD5PB99_9FUNG|nr:hypothetical protein BDA99DRAFT_548095 [Phascolomyces articulosus]